MLDISSIKLGTVIVYKDNPYVVISAQHSKQARGGAILKTKLKNLVTGEVLPHTFQPSETAEAADIERSRASFLYQDGTEFHFMESESYEQFFLEEKDIEEQAQYLKEGLEVDVLKYESKPVAITLPIKVEYEVTEAPPGVKGDSAGSVTKQITLENGLTINAPLFIKQGEKIIVNTESGEYVERA